MPSDPRKLLYDIAAAAEVVLVFTQGRSLQDYEDDRMLSSACERQLEIIGEAMTRLRDRHPETFARFDYGKAIIAFRNRLIHGYDAVDSRIVWDVIVHKLAALELVARQLLGNVT